jgi:TRAP-type C4-dicarboxylate transport system permease small subunit
MFLQEQKESGSVMKKFLDFLFHLLKLFAASCLAAMIVMVFGNVVLRYAFNSGITVSEELSSWCLTWMTYTAGLVALRDHGHLGFDAFLTKMPAWSSASSCRSRT